MTSPFVGQITLYAFAFAPKGWALCRGQLLPINQNQALFALLSNRYGGDGSSNFALPNLQANCVVGQGTGTNGSYTAGQAGGEPSHTLVQSEIPSHTHQLLGDTSSPAGSNVTQPSGKSLGLAQVASPNKTIPPQPFYPYATTGAVGALDPTAVSSTGGMPHENRMPSLVLN